MADRPLLVFPSPVGGKRQKLPKAFPGKTHFPDAKRQRTRLGPQLTALKSAFAKKAATVQLSPSGASPEHVIVLETVGSIEKFATNVRKIDGMEWLAEYVSEIIPDEDFFVQPDKDEEADPDALLKGRIVLVMANQKGLGQLLRYWRLYKKAGGQFEYGDGRWKELFAHLRSVRLWDAGDRLGVEVIKELGERVDAGDELVRVEVELWFRRDEARQAAAEERTAALIAELSGEIVSRCVIPGIAYHALLLQVPIAAVPKLSVHSDTKLVHSDDVMYFRPCSQLAVRTAAESIELSGLLDAKEPTPGGQPVAALLDGLPLEQHEALAGRLLVDDPDGFADGYTSAQRLHGSAMASLILRGDMHEKGTPLERPLYVRPILRPVPTLNDEVDERMPAEMLPVDLVHRAIRRMFESEDGQPPAAPTVKVINFSVGDESRQFVSEMSPLGRLIDWLAVKYNVLFVVSAGNQRRDIELAASHAALAAAQPEEVQRETIRALLAGAVNRRLLAPAEAMNALTVGSLHADASPDSSVPTIRELVVSRVCPSPINALGLGFRGSVKPDVLAPGGRAHFRSPALPTPTPRFALVNSPNVPGCRAAMPRTGSSRGYGNFVGTSNAAALTTRAAVQLLRVIDEAASSPDGEGRSIDRSHDAVLLRALLVHSARWGDARGILEAAFGPGHSSYALKGHLARFLGYGPIEPSRVVECVETRATVLATGILQSESSHAYRLPLPGELAGKKVWRRLGITVAWLAPTDAGVQAYRTGRLWVDPPKAELSVSRRDAEYRMARRGTVQHEILEGADATAFGDEENLNLVVNCEVAGNRKAMVPYALVATLEVSPGQPIPVYTQVRDRLRAAVAVAAKVATKV